MRLPGTLKTLLAQVKSSPVKIGSIAITPEGGVSLTFVEAAPPPPKAPETKLTASKPLRERDTVGAFRTPPIERGETWKAPEDSQ